MYKDSGILHTHTIAGNLLEDEPRDNWEALAGLMVSTQYI